MRPSTMLVALLIPSVVPAALFAQTPDIQDQVEEILHPRPWYVRTWAWLETATGVSPAVWLPLLLVLVAVLCLWVLRRKRES